MAVTSEATTLWFGSLTEGHGTTSLDSSDAAEFPVTWAARSEGVPGKTNPEELLGAAHAGCYSMALAHALSQAGHKVERIATTATVSLDKDAKGFAITGIALRTRGKVAGIDDAAFQRFAEDTKTGCIVSRALAAVPMTLDAALE